MPALVAKRGKKFRVVERRRGQTVLVKNTAGTAVDGGGHRTRVSAQRQAAQINRRS